MTTHYFDVELELYVSHNNCVRWRTAVGFSPMSLPIGLFGIAGGLEFFHISMSVIDGWFALSPHPLINASASSAYPYTPHPIA